MSWYSCNWTSSDGSSVENDDVVDPFVFVWCKFWSEREYIKTAISCSDRNMQGAYEGMKNMIDSITNQHVVKQMWEDMFDYGNTFK